jgi:hypothetical protein
MNGAERRRNTSSRLAMMIAAAGRKQVQMLPTACHMQPIA